MDPLLILMVAVLAVFVFMQFRSSKKRRADQETLRAKIVPGAQVMTQFGVYGTLLSIDADTNEALVETTPGTILRLHSQTILKVIEDETTDEVEAADADAIESAEIDAAEPEFGERTLPSESDSKSDATSDKAAKKVDE